MRTRPRHLAAVIRRAAPVMIASVALALWSHPVRAQEMAPPIPDPSYGAAPAPIESGAAQAQMPDPMGAVDDPGTSASVPIPGGGAVQAQGPDGVAPSQQLPPTENWGTSQIDPNGSGTTPMGP